MEGEEAEEPKEQPSRPRASMSTRRINALLVGTGTVLFVMGLIIGNVILPRGSVSTVLPFLPSPPPSGGGSNPSGSNPQPNATTPRVTFGSLSRVNDTTWRFAVVAASPNLAPGNYRVNVELNGTAGTVSPFPGTPGVPSIVPVSGASAQVVWSETSADGKVDAGDAITLTVDPAPVSSTSVVFLLLYSDGSTVTQESWTA